MIQEVLIQTPPAKGGQAKVVDRCKVPGSSQTARKGRGEAPTGKPCAIRAPKTIEPSAHKKKYEIPENEKAVSLVAHDPSGEGGLPHDVGNQERQKRRKRPLSESRIHEREENVHLKEDGHVIASRPDPSCKP